jgi:hypothetical protein
MGQTPKYGLRWPEQGDPAEAWTAVGNLAADVETMYQGAVAVPAVSAGWAWYGTPYGDGIAVRAGRVVTIDGLLKRTGANLTLSASPATPVPVLTVPWAPDPSRSFTGEVYITNGQSVRWYLPGGQSVLNILHPGGAGTYTFATNTGVVAMSVRYVTAA